jgi:Uncharacterized conserved protein
MTGDTYLTLSSNGEAVYTEKRSKFFAFAEHVEDEESAKARVAALRKQFYDARHVCFAYVLDSNGQRTRSNDDGEPSGTAGRPILGALRSAGLTFTLAVVVRYFGGVKLGTGGLVVAYREAAAAAIAEATVEERLIMEQFRVEVPYTDADVAMRFIRDGGGEITARDFSAEGTTLTIEIRASLLAPLRERLGKILSLRFLDEEGQD